MGNIVRILVVIPTYLLACLAASIVLTIDMLTWEWDELHVARPSIGGGVGRSLGIAGTPSRGNDEYGARISVMSEVRLGLSDWMACLAPRRRAPWP